MEKISHSLSDTKSIAQEILSLLAVTDRATVIALSGNLGGGKTTLTQCIAELLCITEVVTSPTFVIMKKYPITHYSLPFACLVHVDAYRLNGGSELEALGFKKELENKENLIIIEWPEIVQDLLPPDKKAVICEFIDENTRKFIF